jgi:CxxC motif-containing protein (DUF1111 family)
MEGLAMQVTRSATSLGGVFAWMAFCLVVADPIGGAVAADPKSGKPDPVATGYEIFNREWLPNDPRSHGGDGLGPVYNDSSCVACHNAGGSGGAGPVSKNIEILNASRNVRNPINNSKPLSPIAAEDQPQTRSSGPSESLDPLIAAHAGFRTSRTVVLHKFGVDPNYEAWRSQVLTPPSTQGMNGATMGAMTIEPSQAPKRRERDPDAERAMERLNKVRSEVFASNASNRQPLAIGSFLVGRSQRNPTPLFGLGLVDSIADEAILAMEARQAKESPETRGRVSRLKDGRIGRLGWKGQIGNAEDFVLNACAVEVGLEVPGHHQAMAPQAPKYRATGLDLTAEECSALVAYVRSLPQPVERRPSADAEAKQLDSGRAHFAVVGCANCHTPNLGNVQGIFSDLLLHDMGQEMGDEGSYGEDTSDDDEPLVPRITPNLAANGPAPSVASPPRRGATRQEWKTPPLWGFRDSGPYLHDGRAQTLEQAIAMHGGQGAGAAHRFFKLTPREQLEVQAFLKSLVAPSSVHLARAGD